MASLGTRRRRPASGCDSTRAQRWRQRYRGWKSHVEGTSIRQPPRSKRQFQGGQSNPTYRD